MQGTVDVMSCFSQGLKTLLDTLMHLKVNKLHLQRREKKPFNLISAAFKFHEFTEINIG